MQQQHSNPHPHHPHHRGTPGRRRANRHPVNSPARRTYASENDMATDLPFPIDLGGGASPYTPQKSIPHQQTSVHSPALTSQTNNKSKPRSGNKSRQKQPSTSPGLGPVKPGRNTPPQQTTQPKSVVAAAAYAGATFHASPAPSSLPIPSFLAKALDSPGLKDANRASREPTPPATDSEAAPTPQPRVFAKDVARNESPLDFFFRADRAEKERARRASSANVLASNPGPFSPPTEPKSPQEPRTMPNGVNGYRRRPTSQRISSGGISSNELDGTPGKPMGPAFSTPYQDRIRAARSSEKQPEVAQRPAPQSPPQQQQQKQQHNAEDLASERLKKFLAVPSSVPTSQPSNQQVNVTPSLANPTQSWTPPAFQRLASAPTASTSAGSGRDPKLLHIEDSLRRMLKISSGPNLSAGPAVNYQSS